MATIFQLMSPHPLLNYESSYPLGVVSTNNEMRCSTEGNGG